MPHMPSRPLPARLLALAIAAIAIVAIGAEFHLMAQRTGIDGVLERLWRLARFFTILTNALVAAVFLAEALGHRVPGRVLAGVLMSILMVGLVYQILLAQPYTGLKFWSDFALHAAVPVLVLVWWLGWAEKTLALRDIPLWLGWPLVYCLYAMVRGLADGVYPYFFLDIGRFGLARVSLNIAGLIVAFAVMALLIWALARLMQRRTAT